MLNPKKISNLVSQPYQFNMKSQYLRFCFNSIVSSFILLLIAIWGAVGFGPDTAHKINLAAISLCLLSSWFLIRAWRDQFQGKMVVFAVIIIVVFSLQIIIAAVRYGYGWHYTNLFTLEP